MPITQERNAEMQGLNTADLLSADDKNVAVEVYDAVGGQGHQLGVEVVLNLDTVSLNLAPTVFSLASDIVTIVEAGLYRFDFMGTSNNAANATGAITIWLEEDPATGTFALVPTAITTYALPDVTGFAASGMGWITKLVGTNYRYRLKITQTAGSALVTTVANRSKLGIIRLFKNG